MSRYRRKRFSTKNSCRPLLSASNTGDQSSVGRIVKFLISFIPSQGHRAREWDGERERRKDKETEFL